MIICICGLIGSGKTTYALDSMNDGDAFIDWDEIYNSPDFKDMRLAGETTKDIVYNLLKDAAKDVETKTWFTCTYPSCAEQELLDRAETKYIWLHSDLERSMRNILKRNRNHEVEHIKTLMEKNVSILSRSSMFIKDRKAKIVSPYATRERW